MFVNSANAPHTGHLAAYSTTTVHEFVNVHLSSVLHLDYEWPTLVAKEVLLESLV
jgi:hypothetical protein